MNKERSYYKISAPIIVGIVLAVFISFSPGSFFILILTAAAALFINRFANRNERNFILGIFLTGLGLRIAFTLLALSWSIFSGHMLNYHASLGCPDYSTPYFLDDSGYHTLRALFTSMYWQGEPLSHYTVKAIIKHKYGFSGYIYILAAFFNIFGYSPISSRFINCLLGALTIIPVYSMTKIMFSERPARLAAVLTAFFPSVFLWSMTNLKETSLMFTTYLMLWSLLEFQRSKNNYFLVIILLTIWSQAFLRFTYRVAFFSINIAVALFYIFYLTISRLSLKKRFLVLLLIVMLGSAVILPNIDKVHSVIEDIQQKALIHHKGVVSTGGLVYKLLPDEFYKGSEKLGLGDFLKMLGKGWFHIIFEPLPWNLESKEMLFSFPQMALWYVLIVFAILGMAISIRYRFRESLALIIYFVLMTSALAVTGGNIGTVFRLRDINTPIILIFSSIGLLNVFSTLRKNGNEGSRNP